MALLVAGETLPGCPEVPSLFACGGGLQAGACKIVHAEHLHALLAQKAYAGRWLMV